MNIGRKSMAVSIRGCVMASVPRKTFASTKLNSVCIDWPLSGSDERHRTPQS
ncbi:Uncharacterised protein [Bordetella pertussis]|nr:Uncharacterised protein [Bordetella pertussis]CFP57845.1 Uncharacterised protein [Bordetella pertussis]